jgi:hypothetical protein
MIRAGRSSLTSRSCCDDWTATGPGGTVGYRFAIAFLSLLLSCAALRAQACVRVDAETCMNGAIYRCAQTGGVKGWILRAPYEKCEVRTESINGKWSGAGHQTPVGASGLANYLIVMTINGNGGSTDYPALRCGGIVTRIGGSESSAMFREHITYGECTDGGIITVHLRNEELAWTWVGSGGNVVASWRDHRNEGARAATSSRCCHAVRAQRKALHVH